MLLLMYFKQLFVYILKGIELSNKALFDSFRIEDKHWYLTQAISFLRLNMRSFDAKYIK